MFTLRGGEIYEQFPQDTGLINAVLTVKEAQKFADANLDNTDLKKLLIHDVKHRLADQLDKDLPI